jgi:hypothetical protein
MGVIEPGVDIADHDRRTAAVHRAGFRRMDLEHVPLQARQAVIARRRSSGRRPIHIVQAIVDVELTGKDIRGRSALDAAILRKTGREVRIVRSGNDYADRSIGVYESAAGLCHQSRRARENCSRRQQGKVLSHFH